MRGSTIRISRARKELLAKYATAAGFLYGVIRVADFVEIFNHYEDEKSDANEVVLALSRLAKTDEVEYSMFDDCITGPNFLPEYNDDRENAKIVLAEQAGKPRYLPDKDEFLRYVDPSYFEPQKPYTDLKTYITKRKLCIKTGLDGVDGDLIDLREMIQSDVHTVEILQSFIDKGYPLSDSVAINAFLQPLTEVINNTRLYENNGFTPYELFTRYERPKLTPLNKEPFNMPTTKKIGRNEPCPCGSGLKYKKCHGKN